MTLPRFQASGPEALAQRRADGDDPTNTPASQTRRAATQRERGAARRAWERERAGQEFDPDAFRRDVGPGLRDAPLAAMMEATGLSRRYCWLIRRGKFVPHTMYWEALERLAGSGETSAYKSGRNRANR
jgi:hypothetical protein